MRACIPAVALALGACATGSTLRSGVGDRILEVELPNGGQITAER